MYMSPPGGPRQRPGAATRREPRDLNPCRARPEPSQTIVTRALFRAEALENIAKHVVFRSASQGNHAFCDIFWRLGAESHAFYVVLAKLGVRAARITMYMSHPGGSRQHPGGATRMGPPDLNPCRANPSLAKPS